MQTDQAANIDAVLGDRIHIQKVVRNLVINPVDAIAVIEHATRSLRVRSQWGDTGYILVSIADSGVGLGSVGNEQIFEIFFTTRPEGIGIGSSICRSIVEAHGGRLWATQKLPRGTVFHFTVPLYVGADPADPAHSRPALQKEAPLDT